MKTQLLVAAAGAAVLATYFLLRRKYANPEKYLEFNNSPHPENHHITRVFAKAKKHATG